MIETEWVADGDDVFADFDKIAVAEHDAWEWGGAVDFDEGDVCFGIDADDVCGDFAVVGEAYVDAVCAVDDVEVCENVAGGVDDESGALGAALVSGIRPVDGGVLGWVLILK